MNLESVDIHFWTLLDMESVRLRGGGRREWKRYRMSVRPCQCFDAEHYGSQTKALKNAQIAEICLIGRMRSIIADSVGSFIVILVPVTN